MYSLYRLDKLYGLDRLALMNCLFCEIISGEIPCEKVYEDDVVLAFLDIHPVNIGHTLVIPKIHYTNLYETPDEALAHMAVIIKKLSIAIKGSLNADGINIEMNNDASAGQIIFHTHLHIIPRFSGDGFTHWHGARGYKEGEATEVAQKISKDIKPFNISALDEFDTWNKIKKATDDETDTPDRFPKEGEVWMSVLGKNIGFEQNGGGENFSRPLLIIKKFNNHMFWAIPLSTKQKGFDFYHNFTDPYNNPVSVILAQMKLVSLKRLKRKLYDLPQEQLDEVKSKIERLL